MVKQFSFNPCCSGYGSQIRMALHRRNTHIIVSILVVLDMGLKSALVSRLTIPARPVSILVVLDMGLKSKSSAACVEIIKRFQSLLFWIWVSNAYSGRGRCVCKRVSILVVLDMGLKFIVPANTTAAGTVFQSLLFWIWVSNWMGAMGKWRHSAYRFQSLLFWIWVSNVPQR